ncbi:MAG: AAA family ATPase [Candidatus Brocadiae bacterium]|nr:AAA family ATPase [Candidatus Brocadiia bacterium]
MLKGIKINGYKTFHNFELTLNKLNVLIGPNAVGKSNFLDALQLLSRLVTCKSLKDCFDPPYRGRPIESFTLPEKGIEGLIEKDSVHFSISMDVELSQPIIDSVNKEIKEMHKGYDEKKNGKDSNYIKERFLRYTIEIELMPKQGYLRICDESLYALHQNLKGVKKSRAAFLKKTEENRLSLRMEGQGHSTYYDLGMDHTVLSLRLYPPHYPHITGFIRELESWRFFYLEPRERMRAANPTKEIRHIGMMGEELAAYLHGLKINPAKKQHYDSLCRAIKIIIPSIDKIDTDIDKKTGDVELFIVENNRPISSRLVSEGTLRILGLLSITGDNDNPSLICFEEPENGIHPRRIKLIAEFLKNIAGRNTQIIATTHSPVFSDEIANDSLYVCKKKNGITEIIPFHDYNIGIDKALDEGVPLPSELILRGDLDA